MTGGLGRLLVMSRQVHVPYSVSQDETGMWCASAELRPGVGAVGDGTTAEEAVAGDRVIAARGQRRHVFPRTDVAGSGRPVTGREDPPVASESDGVQVPGRDGGEVAPAVNGALPPAVDSRSQC